MFIEWETLARNVWVLRGLPPNGVIGISPSTFTVVAVAEGDIVYLHAGERIDSLDKSRSLARSLRAAGFKEARAIRRGKERRYK